jgi:hypothetical protein
MPHRNTIYLIDVCHIFENKVLYNVKYIAHSIEEEITAPAPMIMA